MNGRNNLGKILVVIVSAAILIIMCFLIAQKVGSYVGIQTQITLEKLSLEQDKQRLSQLENLSKQEKDITDTIEACKKLMPGEPQEDELIKYIQSIANDAMVNFIQITFEPRAQVNNYASMPVKISFEGNYSTLVDFLKKLRSGERAIRVDSVAVTSTGNGAMDIKAELAANAFYTVNAAAGSIVESPQ